MHCASQELLLPLTFNQHAHAQVLLLQYSACVQEMAMITVCAGELLRHRSSCTSAISTQVNVEVLGKMNAMQ